MIDHMTNHVTACMIDHMANHTTAYMIDHMTNHVTALTWNACLILSTNSLTADVLVLSLNSRLYAVSRI